MATLISLSVAFLIVSVANGYYDDTCANIEKGHREAFEKQIKAQYPSLYYQCELEGAALDFIQHNDFHLVKKVHPLVPIDAHTSIVRIKSDDEFENLVLYAFDLLDKDFTEHSKTKSAVGCNYQYNLKTGNEIACVFANPNATL
ncbi:unnamed protein product [Cylicocyclus nassatus]|uniref:Uncharacterized protein n=1 Tax=Cylicocyclus nassatus TaxID=53992 RepID=A0AA36GHP5_CYLNA|nr:unnamed protein product [Cylicocyclus nassatus]